MGIAARIKVIEEAKQLAYEALAPDCSINAEGGECAFCRRRAEMIVDRLYQGDYLSHDGPPDIVRCPCGAAMTLIDQGKHTIIYSCPSCDYSNVATRPCRPGCGCDHG